MVHYRQHLKIWAGITGNPVQIRDWHAAVSGDLPHHNVTDHKVVGKAMGRG